MGYELTAAITGQRSPDYTVNAVTPVVHESKHPARLRGHHDRILLRPEVEVRTGLSRSTIYEMMAEGTFPRPLKLGKRAVGWTSTSIERWLDDRQPASPEIVR